MKLTPSGLLNDSDTVCVDPSGRPFNATTAGFATTATSLMVDNASLTTKFKIISSNANNRTSTTAPYTYMPVLDGLNINFKLNYTFVMRNKLYFRTELMFMCSNGVDDHTFILSLKESNRMNDLQGSYDPSSNKWFSALTFHDASKSTYNVRTFVDLSVNTLYSVDKSYTGLYISASQNIVNLESTQTAEILIWPRSYFGDTNLTV